MISTEIDTNQLMVLLMAYGGKVVFFLLGLFITWAIAKICKRLVLRPLSRANLDYSLQTFISKIVYWIVISIGLVSCLGVFGVQTASFAAVLASMGFAVGMALQGTLGNFASGIMLLVFRPFKTGDTVKINGTTGTVSEIDIFNTILKTADNIRVIIPSKTVLDNQIENMTYHDTRRVSVAVGTGYGEDIEKTRKILLNCVSNADNVLKDPKPAVVVTALADSSVNWSVRAWVKTEDYWSVLDQLTQKVKQQLDANEIEIPFPQLTVTKSN